MNVRVTSTGLSDPELHEKVTIVETFKTRVCERCPWPGRARQTVLDSSKCTSGPLGWNCLSNACITRTIVEWHIVMVEAQMDLAITADPHANGVVFVQSSLHIIGECKILPLSKRRRDLATPQVDVVLAVPRSSFVEGYVLVVAESGQGVLLESKPIETDGAFYVICDVPILRFRDGECRSN